MYKLVGLPSDLPYYHLREGFEYINATASAGCDGERCGPGIAGECGSGVNWEACFPLRFAKVEELTMTDAYSEGRGVRVVEGPCSAPQASCEIEVNYGGLIDFAATFRWLKEDAAAAGDIVIGALAGDFMAPSYLAEIHRGKQLVEVMSHMGVDLVVFGNHDVDVGLQTLRDQMSKSAFHYLNANIEAQRGGGMQQPMLDDETIEGNMGHYNVSTWRRLHKTPHGRYGDGWAMLEQDGVRVCVLGTTDVDKMAWPAKGVTALARDIPAALAILKLWDAQALGCSLKIAMTHTRSGNDLNLFRAAEMAGFHLDAIIAAHDHYAAFLELTRGDGGTTFLIKAGSDARAVAKLTFELNPAEPVVGALAVVPVVSGSCQHHQQSDARREWFAHTEEIYRRYVTEADEADRMPLNITYYGIYNTNSVRDAESRAVNMWLDLMRESLNGDALFFQAGLVRQDMFQHFKKGHNLSQLFMLEEFPWGDADVDARSSLFPFRVGVADLVTKTLPFLARKFWCRAPFNSADRVHLSGFIVETVDEVGCDASGANPIESITFVGGCHRRGTLHSLDTGCCKGALCGRLWRSGSWDPRITEELRAQLLTVLTGQFCVPSKFNTFRQGFHEIGMLCPGVERPENWGGGAEFARQFEGEGVMDQRSSPHAAPEWERLGFLFKPAVLSLLGSQAGPSSVGRDIPSDCSAASSLYVAETFVARCLCEMKDAGAAGCVAPRNDNPFPRFFTASRTAYVRASNDQGSCAATTSDCTHAGAGSGEECEIRV